MPTDIRLDEAGGSWIVLDSGAVKMTGADLLLDSAPRRRSSSGHRRALVHDSSDGLTINFNKDYPSGVTIHGPVRIVGDLEVRGRVSVHSDRSPNIWNLAEKVAMLEEQLKALYEYSGLVTVPDWPTREEVEEGDEMQVSNPSAESLGLIVQWSFMNDGPEEDHRYVVGIDPKAGSLVPRGTTVHVTLSTNG